MSQAEIARVIRAAKQAGAAEVEVRSAEGVTILIRLKSPHYLQQLQSSPSKVVVATRRDKPSADSQLSDNENRLLAQYDGLSVIPLDRIVSDYFRHLTVEKFLRKVLAGEISIPVVRIESSQKAAKGIHVSHLAAYLAKQAEAARKECEQLGRSA